MYTDNNINYKEKYLKYKNKYLELKYENNMNGGATNIVTVIKDTISDSTSKEKLILKIYNYKNILQYRDSIGTKYNCSEVLTKIVNTMEENTDIKQRHIYLIFDKSETNLYLIYFNNNILYQNPKLYTKLSELTGNINKDTSNRELIKIEIYHIRQHIKYYKLQFTFKETEKHHQSTIDYGFTENSPVPENNQVFIFEK